MENIKPPTGKDVRLQIQGDIRELAKILGMMPNDALLVTDARNAFHALAVHVGRALDIQLQ